MAGDENKRSGMARGLTEYGDPAFAAFLRKSFIKAMGYTDDALSKPIVGIVDTSSGFNACHATVPSLIKAIERGVMLAGGLPVPFPVISLHESFAHPTSMYLRNLMSMDVEEMIRAQPMDAVVLIGGCDKTVPALLMGAFSADRPCILEVTGPMLSGSLKGQRIGACTDCRRLWGEFRGGRLSEEETVAASNELVPSAGTCGVMGTASTMALMAEAMGVMLPGGAAIPAVLSDRLRHAERTGTSAVALAKSERRPSQFITQKNIDNAISVLQAIGGSTNAVVHLAAIAGRLGLDASLQRLDAIGRQTPVLVDLKPAGQYYMDDLHKAGGLAPVLRSLRKTLHEDADSVTGDTLGEVIGTSGDGWPQKIVKPIEDALFEKEGIVPLFGTLAPNGAVMKQAAASPEFLQYQGRAVVFDGLADLAERVDRDDLDVTPEDVLILRNAGPIGAPGMPEAGYIPIPKKLARAGVKDMLRISDARMSGTAFGSIILHVAPESAVGGPLSLVENGDLIRLDVAARLLDLVVSPEVLRERHARTSTRNSEPMNERGYRRLFLDHVLQADEGCDFDYLRPQT